MHMAGNMAGTGEGAGGGADVGAGAAFQDAAETWVPVCALEDIVPFTGVCAMVGGRQVAVVRVGDGSQVYAVDNFDPFSKAFVISRGIVGDKNGVAKIASPIFKQNFDLRTGQCLDNPAVALATYRVRVRDGRVEILLATPDD